MLYQAGIFIAFFLFFLLITKRGKNPADKILAVWLFIVGLHLTFFYLFISDQYLSFQYLLGLEIPLPLFHGPFLYFYIAALTNQMPPKKIKWIHAVPIITIYLAMIPFFLLSSAGKIQVYQNDGLGYESMVLMIFMAIVLSGLTYTILSLHLLRKHKKNIVNQFSNTEKINLNWIKYLIVGLSAIWLLVIFSDDTFIFGAVVLYVIFIGYFGIKQVGIFTYNPGEAISVSSVRIPAIQDHGHRELILHSNGTPSAKYAKSALSLEDSQRIHRQLTSHLEESNLYQNPGLTLAGLSKELGVHPNILSQVINSNEQKNFYDFINTWRINKFIEMAREDSNKRFTLLAMAYDCGFNSKTSFNRNFKKVTGLSPTTYLQEHKIALK